jgi:hypothetical protein
VSETKVLGRGMDLDENIEERKFWILEQINNNVRRSGRYHPDNAEYALLLDPT